MNTPSPAPHRTLSARALWFMVTAWAVIVAKCIFVTWAVDRWHMPFAAGWVVWPTLAFAALATGLWLAHRE